MGERLTGSTGLSTNYTPVNKIAMKSSYVAARAGDLRFCHLNPGSAKKNIDEIRIFFDGGGMDVICVSESWFKSQHLEKHVGIPGYKLFRADRARRRGGGVAIYVRKDLKSKILSQSLGESLADFLVLEITFHGQKIMIGTIYNPPRVNGLPIFFPALANLVPMYRHCILLGDFNIDLLVTNRETTEFRSKLDDLALSIISSEPTHFQSTPTLIDLCITNNPDLIQMFSQISLPGIPTDHDLIYGFYHVCDAVESVETTSPKFYRDFNAVNIENLLRDVAMWDFRQIFFMPDPNDQVHYFNAIIISLFQAHVPLKIFYPKDEANPWLNFEIASAMTERDIAYRIWSNDKRNDAKKEHLKMLRKTVRSLVRSAKRRAQVGRLDPSLPSKKLWRNLDEVGVRESVDKDIIFSADELSEYYASLGAQSSQINDISDYGPQPAGETFSFQNVTDEEVVKAVSGVKSNAIGLDGISLKFLKLLLPAITPCITHIFNTILTTSTFPKAWKVSKVLPIPKKKNPSELSDYRPISILPSLSKAIELLMRDQIVQFLDRHKLLNEFQSGFRPAHGTTTALLKISDDLQKARERKLVSILLLLDFSKAFDSIIHSLLCAKLSDLYRFGVSAVKLVKSYLSERFQAVCVGEVLSEMIPLLRGVAQGSVLGPLLFSLFINDLPASVRFCNHHLYADDVQLYLSCDSTKVNDGIRRVNEDLESVFQWAFENGLTLNPQKSQAIVLNYAFIENLPPIILNGTRVPYCEKVTNLGLIINQDLTWTNQVNQVIKRVYGALSRLWTTANLIPTEIRRRLIMSLVLPLFLHCDVIFSKAQDGLKERLKLAFNSCARYVYNIQRSESISGPVSRVLGMSFEKYLSFRICCQMHRIISTQCPQYLYQKLHVGHSTRLAVLHPPRHTLTSTANSFFVRGVTLWNLLPVSIRGERRDGAFRTSCRAFIEETTLPIFN